MFIHALINRISSPRSSEHSANTVKEMDEIKSAAIHNLQDSRGCSIDRYSLMQLESKARSVIADANTELVVVQLPLDSLPSRIRERTLAIRAWRQQRKDSKSFEDVENVLPEVRRAEEELRQTLESLNTAKQHEKSKLLNILGLLKVAYCPCVPSFETEMIFLRQCIDELSNESISLKSTISFWEEVLKQRRLESISKGMAFTTWAHLNKRGHTNGDKDLNLLHERLQAVRQAREASMQCLSKMLCTREGGAVAQKLLANCISAIEGLFTDDCVNHPTHLETLTRIINDSTLVPHDVNRAIDQAQDIAETLLNLSLREKEASKCIIAFLELREELAEVRIRLGRSLKLDLPSLTGSFSTEDGSLGGDEDTEPLEWGTCIEDEHTQTSPTAQIS